MSRTRYSALWVEQQHPVPWELHKQLTESETQQLAERMAARGFRPTYLNRIDDGSLTTLWIADDGASEVLLGLTYREVKQLEEERQETCPPICIDSRFDGQRREGTVGSPGKVSQACSGLFSCGDGPW